MARSTRRSPFIGITTARSEKLDKRLANRRLRGKTRACLRTDPLREPLPTPRSTSDPWLMAKDGKFRIDVQRAPELMRK